MATCKNHDKATKGKDIRYFTFPKDIRMRKLWVNLMKRGDEFNPKNVRVCSEHFTGSDYERDLRSELMGVAWRGRRVLKEDAVPTINMPGSCKRKSYGKSTVTELSTVRVLRGQSATYMPCPRRSFVVEKSVYLALH